MIIPASVGILPEYLPAYLTFEDVLRDVYKFDYLGAFITEN